MKVDGIFFYTIWNIASSRCCVSTTRFRSISVVSIILMCLNVNFSYRVRNLIGVMKIREINMHIL